MSKKNIEEYPVPPEYKDSFLIASIPMELSKEMEEHISWLEYIQNKFSEYSNFILNIKNARIKRH